MKEFVADIRVPFPFVDIFEMKTWNNWYNKLTVATKAATK